MIKNKPTKANKIQVAIIVGLILLLAFLVWSDLPEVFKFFRNFKLIYIVPVLLLSLANYFIRFLKWQLYLKSLFIKINRKESLAIFFSGLAFAITPAKMGEVYKSYLLKVKFNIPISKTAPIVIIDRLTDFISFIFLGGLGVFIFRYCVLFFISLSIFLALLLFILSSKKFSFLFLNKLSKFRFFRNFLPYLENVWNSTIIMTDPKIILISIFLGLFAWSAECLAFWVVLQGINITNISVFSAFFIYAFSMILGAISMIPGGLGIQESSMAGLLILMSLNKTQSTAATLIVRAGTLWFAVLVGIFALIITQRSLKKP
jgi:uncharacterized protein (TIRG00374 family)